MHIALAPMQVYADAPMRDLFGEIGGLDEVVAEFVRVSHSLHSRASLKRKIPELNHGARTFSGVPCTVQLLGSDGDALAQNAVRAVECGARKIDLNFGCPSPTVNKHGAGAVLLDFPQKIEAIVRTVRQALPRDIPLSAKIRLGVRDTGNALAVARAAAQGGAAMLTVHARTRDQGYAPPVRWSFLSPIRNALDIPVFANGDIFSAEDFHRLCDAQPDTPGIMLGRGMLRRPDLARQIRAEAQGRFVPAMNGDDVLALLARFGERAIKTEGDTYAAARIKQWLPLLSLTYPDLRLPLSLLRRQNAEQITEFLRRRLA